MENRVHYVRDVTFGEDRSRIRTGFLPDLWAIARNLTAAPNWLSEKYLLLT